MNPVSSITNSENVAQASRLLLRKTQRPAPKSRRDACATFAVLRSRVCLNVLLITATLGAAALLAGCPPVEEPHIILGTWDYIEDALDGYVRWEIKPNGTIEQTDLGHGILAGNLTWVLTGPNDIRISQDNGVNQWLLEGTIYSEDYMAGTWMQVAGADTGTHGTWTANRFP